MQNGNEIRPWEELIPDALGQIFCNLSLKEILTVVPRVCKSWGKVVNGPYCWQEIDIEKWSNLSEPPIIDRMVRVLIPRSCGALRKLCVSEVQSDTFIFIGENARALKTLRLPRSDINDTIVEQVAPNLSSLTSLDLSCCRKLGAQTLESIGKHCKSLTRLRWNMHPISINGEISQADEAHAIAKYMPNLKQLEIAYMLIDTSNVLEILSNCPFLERLDLRGCWNVTLAEEFVKEKFPKLEILGPEVHVMDHYEVCSDFSESFYDSDSFDGIWQDEDDLELEYYDRFEYADYGWPSSP